MNEELRELLRQAWEIVSKKYPNTDYFSMSVNKADGLWYNINRGTRDNEFLFPYESGNIVDGAFVPKINEKGII